MFTALHRPTGEYDAPAPFAMPSYASVMSQFNHVSRFAHVLEAGWARAYGRERFCLRRTANQVDN